jgi:hypothetical protein
MFWDSSAVVPLLLAERRSFQLASPFLGRTRKRPSGGEALSNASRRSIGVTESLRCGKQCWRRLSTD